MWAVGIHVCRARGTGYDSSHYMTYGAHIYFHCVWMFTVRIGFSTLPPAPSPTSRYAFCSFERSAFFATFFSSLFALPLDALPYFEAMRFVFVLLCTIFVKFIAQTWYKHCIVYTVWVRMQSLRSHRVAFHWWGGGTAIDAIAVEP